MRRKIAAALGVLLGATAITLVATVGLREWRAFGMYRTLYDFSPPARIHWCGRDYAPGDLVIANNLPVTGGTYAVIDTMPSGRQVLTRVLTADERNQFPCPMILYVQEGNDYRAYGLEGGP
jgi:hypothetical protein